MVFHASWAQCKCSLKMYCLPNSLFYTQNQIKTHILLIDFFPTSTFSLLREIFGQAKYLLHFLFEDFFLLFAKCPEE